MSISRITPDDFETFTLETNPARTYSSSSVAPLSGTINLFARRSTVQKEIYPLSIFSQSLFSDQNIDEFRQNILRATSSLDISSLVTTYMSAVNAQGQSARLLQTKDIIRFEPPFSFNSNTLRKSVVVNTLMPFYRTSYPRAHFNYVNYHCLNFYSSSNVPTASVLLYPNPTRAGSTLTQYGFSGSFSFDFWIKPKYSGDGRDASAVYRPGALMHLTGAYALSLHSGSHKDINGRPDAFKLLLQVSSSTDTPPDQVSAGQFAFFSSDNCLPIDRWSHVTIRWGGTEYNHGTGSFVVDQQTQGYFVMTGSLLVGDQSEGDPSVLCVGNYYQGQNAGINALTYFFTNDTAQREGLYELQAGAGLSPGTFAFNYPLQAEVHELKLYQKYLNTDEISALDTRGPAVIDTDLLFYLPPFFTEESPVRTFYGTDGGIPVTPFFTKDGSTKHPFATDMAFGCGGHYINLENYVRDFVTGRFPRLWNLTGSIINETFATPLSANSILYNTGSNIKRLYSILPCDNGNMLPNFDLLRSLSGSTFVSDLGTYDPGVISLRNMLTASYPSQTMTQVSGGIVDILLGGNSPDNVGDTPGDGLAIFHRTRDNTSNQVVFFDISNLFYGNQIKPGTFVLRDTSLSASNGAVSLTLRDDGIGNLYRADANQDNLATWASVGNIFYNEGIVLLKMPQLYFFGLNQFDIEFQGVQNIHVLSINAFARSAQLTTSSNPSFSNGTIDDLANVDDGKYVFISTVHLHDNNLNVIGRTNIAQPILKRSSDKFLFKIKMDY